MPTVARFNAVSATGMRKALRRVADGEGFLLGKDAIERIVAASNGDVRSAIHQLQFDQVDRSFWWLLTHARHAEFTGRSRARMMVPPSRRTWGCPCAMHLAKFYTGRSAMSTSSSGSLSDATLATVSSVSISTYVAYAHLMLLSYLHPGELPSLPEDVSRGAA